MHYVMFKTIKL